MIQKQILLSPRAQKSYASLNKDIQVRIKQALKELAAGSNKDIKKLKGVSDREDLYRLRVGEYRITYHPEPDTIEVIRIDHRGKGYEWLN